MADERVLNGLDALCEQIAEKEAEIAKLKTAANMLASVGGLEPRFPDVDVASAAPGPAKREVVQPDQFVDYSAPSTAARAFLEWRWDLRGKKPAAATIDEIHTALVAGGFDFDNRNAEEAKNGLRVALGKDQTHIKKLTNGFYGLTAWYPNARKERTKAKEANGKKDDGATPAPPQTFADENDDFDAPEGDAKG